MKTLDTSAYISMLRKLTEQGNEVSLVIKGGSMTPFLADQRDTIFFCKPVTPLSAGQIVFYQRPNGQFVVHRICKIRNGQLYIAGDAEREIEGPVSPEQVFARVTRIRRKNKMIGPGDFWWEFFEHIWIHMIPLRRPIMGLYAFTARFRHITPVV